MKRILSLALMAVATFNLFCQSIPTTGDTLKGAYKIQIIDDNGTKLENAFGKLYFVDGAFSLKTEVPMLGETKGLFDTGSPKIGGDMLIVKVIQFGNLKERNDRGYLQFYEVKKPEQYPICFLTVKTSLQQYKYQIRIFDKLDL